MISRHIFFKIPVIILGLFIFAQASARIPSPPRIEAESYVLVDFHSSKVLAAKNEHERLDPASLTKMMTMYVIDQELKDGHITLEDEVHVSKKAWQMQGSRMFIEVGSKVTVEELVKGVIIQSGNDASIALAEHIAGTEESFVNIMNQQAQRLGMVNTKFQNVTGFPSEDHYSTAYDMSLLSIALIKDFPESYSLYSEKWFSYQGIKQANRNRLLWRETFVDGIKTGHSSSAGYCLAASGEQDGMRLVSVVLGTDSDSARTDYSQRLLRFGFRFFETHKLFGANEPVKEPKIWMGATDKIRLGLPEDLYITVPQGEYENLNAQVNFDKHILAPINIGDQQGVLTVKLEDEVILEQPLVALDEVEQGGIWSRFTDYVSLKVRTLFGSKA